MLDQPKRKMINQSVYGQICYFICDFIKIDGKNNRIVVSYTMEVTNCHFDSSVFNFYVCNSENYFNEKIFENVFEEDDMFYSSNCLSPINQDNSQFVEKKKGNTRVRKIKAVEKIIEDQNWKLIDDNILRRQARNRVAAERSRMKKLAAINDALEKLKNMEERVRILEEENKNLKIQLLNQM